MTMLIFMGGQSMAQRGDGAVRRRGVAVAGDAFTHARAKPLANRRAPRRSRWRVSLQRTDLAGGEHQPSLRR